VVPERLRHPLARYVAATRPAFLVVTLVAGMLGIAGAAASGVRIDVPVATVALLAALVAHAGANVINDYFDARSGTDAINTERLYPYTGGSRLIQNGVLSLRATGVLGAALLGAVIPAGLWLTARSSPGLLLIGMAGLSLGWAYSAPPLRLASRGLGEVAVAAGWLLIVVGSDFVQRHAFAFVPLASGGSFALLVASLLYINQFPDARADAHAGKRTLIVRLGPARARWGYAILAALAAAWVLIGMGTGALPWRAAVSLLPLALSASAARILWRHAAQPALLRPAIQRTIRAAVWHGLLLCAALAVR
jgi:1,4-dihydroxy-2-naphthoate octaprenyltransferase